ncbi:MULTISPECIES: hypothetical protein [Ensifer]|uniref:hypothetical protein n=1 Tax=Ensifer TaxID=106591 RepID=UPI0012E332CD|nr:MULTISPECIES: hypothetical protein [Ensifer]
MPDSRRARFDLGHRARPEHGRSRGCPPENVERSRSASLDRQSPAVLAPKPKRRPERAVQEHRLPVLNLLLAKATTMNAKQILRFMKDREAGIDRDNIKTAREHLVADAISSGRDVIVEGVDEDGQPLVYKKWVPTKKSTGTRKPAERTKGHSRGYIVDPASKRAIGFESTHEMRCAMMLLANKDVVHLEDQPPAVHYRDAKRVHRKHTFDYRATFADGRRVAIAVKPSHLLESSGIRDVIKRIKPKLHGFADQALILTERNLTIARGDNAEHIVHARRYRNEADCEELQAFLEGVPGIFRIYEVVNRFPDFAAAMNAMWCLIYDGFLKLAYPDRTLRDAPYAYVVHLRN